MCRVRPPGHPSLLARQSFSNARGKVFTCRPKDRYGIMRKIILFHIHLFNFIIKPTIIVRENVGVNASGNLKY